MQGEGSKDFCEERRVAGKILIAYATKWGSTEETARFIGEAFAAEGAEAEVKSVHEVSDLEGCRAVLLGSPLYSGKLLGEAYGFEKTHREALSRIPRALFITCLTMARPSRGNVQKVVSQTRPFVETFRPADVGLFAGKLDYSNVGFLYRLFMRLAKIPEGDFRNWDVIRGWAKDVLGVLSGGGVQQPAGSPTRKDADKRQ